MVHIIHHKCFKSTNLFHAACYYYSMSELLEKAEALAYKYQKEDKRESGESLYAHLEAIVNKMSDAGITDEKVLASALLHHLPGKITGGVEIIKTEVDEEVAKIVGLYHNLAQRNIKKETPKHFNENYIVQTYINLAQDMRVLVLALANQCQNIETAFALPPDRRKEVAEKTLFLYAPIAKMLGLSHFTKTLENESFKILNPAEYIRVKTIIETSSPRIEKFFEEAVPVLKDLLAENKIDAVLSHRIKSIYSTYKKINYYITRSPDKDAVVYDIGAMRIITQTADQIYAVEDILKSLWEQIPHLRDDYIQKPRPNGYKSLHNTFIVEPKLNIEVQIRTREMHQEAEYGLCSHLFYKIGERFKNELEKNPNWVRDLNYYESYDKATIKHFSTNVYAFTPKGDIIELPNGAKALDFAYYVHTDIGNACAGAKINGRIVKLDTLINDGDIVEILLDRTRKKPSKDWLSLAGTKRARWDILKGLRG